MPFIQDILKYKSVSIVGTEKNTGKTECLNYILNRLKHSSKQIAVTSIGVEGEKKDIIFQTEKPEIEIFEGMIFVTSEAHYRNRQLISEILDVSRQATSLGRLITAKAQSSGKVMISGPSDNEGLKTLIQKLQCLQVDLTLVDGALSRMSLASPAVTQAMVLTTGAAFSSNLQQLVSKTKYVYDLINIESVEEKLLEQLDFLDNGFWAIDAEGIIHNLHIPSVFALEKAETDLFLFGNTIYVSGVVSDKFLNFLKLQKQEEEITLIIRDFSKVFASQATYYDFIRKGNQIKVLEKAELAAVCVNPVAPTGFKMNSEDLCKALHERLGLPVYDVRKLEPLNDTII